MPNALSELSVSELKRAVEIKEQIDALQEELNGLLGGATGATPGRRRGRPPGRRRGPGAAGRARIAAAQKARWASQQGGEAPNGRRKRRRRMSAAGRAAISKAAKERWAKAKAAGKSRL